jgi:hypothetical protein
VGESDEVEENAGFAIAIPSEIALLAGEYFSAPAVHDLHTLKVRIAVVVG